MSRTVSPSTERRYGLARVSRVWQVARSTVYASRSRGQVQEAVRRRPGSGGPCSDEELAERITAIIVASPFHGEGYRKAWARLRFAGVRTSRRRVLRVMRERGLLTIQRLRKDLRKKEHTGTIITSRPDEMWGTDMTMTATTREGAARVFIAVDHCTEECLGIHVSRVGNRFEALDPIRQAVRRVFGRFEEKIADGVAVRHDHGSNYMADDFQREIRFLGMRSSPAFVREPEGNGCSERFIRTLKENLLWVRDFETIEELRRACLDFMRLYNEEWILVRHRYRTPSQVRAAFLAGQEAVA